MNNYCVPVYPGASHTENLAPAHDRQNGNALAARKLEKTSNFGEKTSEWKRGMMFRVEDFSFVTRNIHNREVNSYPGNT